jgi:ribonuclease HI
MVVSRFARAVINLVAHVDGGSLGSPGPAGVGIVIAGAAVDPIKIAKWIGHQDNNVAEYVALLEALQYAVSLNAKRLHVYSDSQVVVKQMMGEYKCRSPRLYSLNWTCRRLARSLVFSISHVSRELNAEANTLANIAVRRHLSSLAGSQRYLFSPATSVT